jgi:tetratricopeptide (TPR) repeat protein
MDSSLLSYDRALRHPGRFTTTQRLVTETQRAITTGDLKGALGSVERILQYDPTNLDALGISGNVLWELGRPEEALDRHRRAKEASPFGPSQVLLTDEIVDLYSLGRVDEARKLVAHLREPQARVQRTNIEIAGHAWAVAESVAAAGLRDPSATDDVRSELLLNLASAQAGQGQLQAAAGTLDLCESVARGAVAPITLQDMARRARLMLSVVSGGVIVPPKDVSSSDRSTATFLTRGLRAALVGDRVAARQFRNAALAADDLARQGGAPALLEARIRGMEGRWADAARILQPFAMQPLEIGGGWHPAGMSAIRWFLADDFEKLGRPDSAGWYLEMCVSDPTSTIQESHIRGIVWPFAQRRLVLLYGRMGRIEDARRHWKILNETFTRPDPALEPMIEEARRALAEAERRAQSRSPA